MRCVLHIGADKTATTSLQMWLYANRKALAQQGVALTSEMGRPNNRMLPALVQRRVDSPFFVNLGIHTTEARDRHFEGFLDRLDDELGRARRWAHTTIYASRHFHQALQSVDEIEALAEVLWPRFDEVEVVCNVREQADLAVSLYAESVQHGKRHTLFDASAALTPDNPTYNHHTGLLRWADVFGDRRISAGVFQPHRPSGDVAEDFGARALSGVSFEDFAVPAERCMARLSALQTAMIRALYLASMSAAHRISVRTKLRPVVDWICRSTRLRSLPPLAHPDAANIHKAFDAVNRDFSTRFLGHGENPFSMAVDSPDAGRVLRALLDELVPTRTQEIAAVVESFERDGALTLDDVVAVSERAAAADDDGEGSGDRWDAVVSAFCDALDRTRPGKGAGFTAETLDDILADVHVHPAQAAQNDEMAAPASHRHVIYFTPRSGSSWLGEALRATGCLGLPTEHFNPSLIAGIAHRTQTNRFDQYCDAILARDRSANGVFATQLAYFQACKMKSLEEFYRWFPPSTPSLLLLRENLVLQAISLYKATETNTFHSASASQKGIEDSQAFDRYDPAAIMRWVRHIRAQEEGLLALFRDRQVQPLALSYETMFADKAAVVPTIAHWFGVTLPEGGGRGMQNQHTKLASQSNDDMETRFRAEHARELADIERQRANLLAMLRR